MPLHKTVYRPSAAFRKRRELPDNQVWLSMHRCAADNKGASIESADLADIPDHYIVDSLHPKRRSLAEIEAMQRNVELHRRQEAKRRDEDRKTADRKIEYAVMEMGSLQKAIRAAQGALETASHATYCVTTFAALSGAYDVLAGMRGQVHDIEHGLARCSMADKCVIVGERCSTCNRDLSDVEKIAADKLAYELAKRG